MNPGGFAPSARRLLRRGAADAAGVKCYERGEPVESVRRMIVNNVRLPVIFWNDVRSLVASNNTGARRLTGTIEEFGADTFTPNTPTGRSTAASDVVAGADRRRSRTGSTRRTSGRRATARRPTCCRSTAA